jgi:hypothetical protein
VDSFGKFNSRFAANSPDMPDVPFSWTPATEFTFDAGIAVMGEAGSGVGRRRGLRRRLRHDSARIAA